MVAVVWVLFSKDVVSLPPGLSARCGAAEVEPTWGEHAPTKRGDADRPELYSDEKLVVPQLEQIAAQEGR